MEKINQGKENFGSSITNTIKKKKIKKIKKKRRFEKFLIQHFVSEI